MAKLAAIIAYNIKRLRRGFQKVFRISHVSDYDLIRFDSYLAKRILPLIKAYRQQYLEREGFTNNAPLELPQEGKDGEKKEWLAVIDDIIFSLRWLIAEDILFDTPEKIAFFKEYYGQYIAYNDDNQKHLAQYDDASSRARKGFELYGRFFVRKSDVPDYDLIDLNMSIAKRILPKIKAYRKKFLKRHKNLNSLNNGPYASLQEYLSDEDKKRIADKSDVENEMCDGVKAFLGADEDKRWLISIDEIIYAMRWCLEADMLNETSKKIAFFKEYYGQYVSPEVNKDKHIEQYDDSLYRAKRGFMSFGYFLSHCGGYVRWIDGNPV